MTAPPSTMSAIAPKTRTPVRIGYSPRLLTLPAGTLHPVYAQRGWGLLITAIGAINLSRRRHAGAIAAVTPLLQFHFHAHLTVRTTPRLALGQEHPFWRQLLGG